MYEYECLKCGRMYYSSIDYNDSYRNSKYRDELDSLDLFFTCACGGNVYYSEDEQFKMYGTIIRPIHDKDAIQSELEHRVEQSKVYKPPILMHKQFDEDD